MYSTHNEGKSFFAERFIRILNNNIYMTSILKNVYIDKLDDIVNKYNNGYHSTIKMKYVDVKSTAYIDAKLMIKVILLENQNEKHFCIRLCYKSV